MYLNIYIKKLAISLFIIINLLLLFPLLMGYPGNVFYVILLFIITNSYIYYSLKFSNFFLDKTLSMFIWLGFFYKLSIIFITNAQSLPEGSGAFDFEPKQFDNLLIYLNIGILSFFISSFFFKLYVLPKFQLENNISNEKSEKKLIEFYKKNKKILYIIFVALILFVTFINFKTGFYQKGLLPKLQINIFLGYFIKWMLLFGLTSITCLLIDYDYKSYKSISLYVILLLYLELFLSNFSLLSRGLIFSGSAILFATYLCYESFHSKKLIKNSLILNFFVLITVFLISVFPINKIRHFENTDLIYIAKKVINKTKIQSKVINNENIDKKTEEQKIEEIVKKLEKKGITSNLNFATNFKRFLFVIKYRFVGLDALAAVVAYPQKNFDLFFDALKDEYNANEYGFYERTFIRPYEQKDLMGQGFQRSSKRQYTVILPGIFAFLSYPGSLFFLFLSSSLIYIFCVGIETLALKFSYNCFVFSSFIGYIIGYRLIHFGYLPKQSYLLFGAILITIVLIKIFSLAILNKKK